MLSAAGENGPILAEVQRAIARLPRFQLCALPTPLQRVPRLAEALGVSDLLIKRDDLSGLALGGNKSRMLEFTIGQALAEGADCIVAGALADSNHCRQAAAAAAQAGLDCYLVLGVRDPAERQHPNVRLEEILGADISFCQATSPTEVLPVAQGKLRDLLNQRRRPVLINLTATSRALGVVAHLCGFLELIEQAETSADTPTHVYVSSAATTYAGLLLGSTLLGSTIRVVGVLPEPAPDPFAQVRQLLSDALTLLGVDLKAIPEPSIDCRYESPTPEIGAAVRQSLHVAGKRAGLLLDPVYTAKGMSGLADHLAQACIPSNSVVVFVHTGGAPHLFWGPDYQFAYCDDNSSPKA